MASPPYNYSPSAMSPPYPSHTPLPQLNVNTTNKKRASEGGPAPALKRRKASTMSATSAAGSAHPLRQTSFPPDESQAGTPYTARSPSVDTASMVSGSQVSAGAAAAPPKKKRGRKSKAEKARQATPSLVGGKAGTVVSAASGGDGRGVTDGGRKGAEEAEEEDDDSGPVIVKNEEQRALDRVKEQKMRAMLTKAMSAAQYERFEIYRVTKVQDASIRRLVNATVSQSVPANFVLGIRSVAKTFVGDIIEEARRVQGEWMEKTDEAQADQPHPSTGKEAPAEMSGIEGPDGTPVARRAHRNDRRGPLRPEHLVEAWRRYKLEYGGGGVGVQGLWHTQQEDGVERFSLRTRGKVLFR